jgi:hypothetical protein
MVQWPDALVVTVLREQDGPMPLKHELQYALAFGMADSFVVDVLSPPAGACSISLHSHGFTVGYFLSDLRS